MSSKHKRKGKSKFIMIDAYVKRSEAWKALTPVERNAYIEVKWRYDGTNNGRIGLGARELAGELGMGRTTASDAMAALQRYGFISISKRSAFHVKNRVATEWRLTEYRCDVTGDLPSKEFMRWSPTKNLQSAPPDTQSAPPDTQSAPPDCALRNDSLKPHHSPLHRTVKPQISISQSAPPDTYISTIPSVSEDEAETVGDLAQRAIQSAVASKVAGRRSPAQREASKKYFSSTEGRRASARETEAKAAADKAKLSAAFMASDNSSVSPIPVDPEDFGPWIRRHIPDPLKHREAYRLLREQKMTPEILRSMAA